MFSGVLRVSRIKGISMKLRILAGGMIDDQWVVEVERIACVARLEEEREFAVDAALCWNRGR